MIINVKNRVEYLITNRNNKVVSSYRRIAKCKQMSYFFLK